MKPQMRVRVAFDGAPLAETPVWTDITQYVYTSAGNDIDINYGRQDEFSAVQPARLSLTLDNSDGRFTPGRADSPYYPNVTKGKRINVEVRGQYNDGSFKDDVNWIYNPGGEIVAGGYPSGYQTFGAGINTSASSHAETGTYGMTFTVNQTGVTAAGIGANHEANLLSEVSGGTAYLISVRAKRRVSPNRPGKIRVQWYSSPTSGVVQTDYSDPVTISTSWTTVQGVFVAPPGAWKCKVAFYVEPADCVNLEVWDTDTWRMDVDGYTYSTSTLVTTDPDTAYFERYTGYVDQWPQVWTSPSANLAESRLVASDRMARIGRAAVWPDIIELEYTFDQSTSPASLTVPLIYWKLGDGSESTSAGQSGSSGASELTVGQFGSGGTLAFGAATGPGTDGISAPLWTPVGISDGKFLTGTVEGYPFYDNQWTVEFFFSSTASGWAQSLFYVHGWNFTNIYLSTTGQVVVEQLGATKITSGTGHADGAVHHVAFTYDNDNIELYVDGVSIGTSTMLADAGREVRIGAANGGSLFNGTISHVAVHNRELWSFEVADHYEAGTGAFEGETSDERIQRIADYAQVVDKYLDTGVTTTMSKLLTHGKSPLQLLRETEVTENGLVFFNRAGELAFQSRAWRYNATPYEIYDVATGDVEEGLLFMEDDTSLVNDATYSQPEGASYRIQNQESITNFDRYTKSETLYTTDATEVLAAAQWAVNRFGTPSTRCPTVAVDIRTQDSMWVTLQVELGDLIRLTNLPDQAPSTEVELFVEGYSERISEEAWTITFNCTPADPESVWVLDSSTYSELGATTRLAY